MDNEQPAGEQVQYDDPYVMRLKGVPGSPRLGIIHVTRDNAYVLKQINSILPKKDGGDVYKKAYVENWARICLMNDRPVGAVGCRVMNDNGWKRLHIRSLAVLLKEDRRQGVGTMLLQHVLRKCYESNIAVIFAIPQLRSEGVEFFKKYFFKESIRLPNFYGKTTHAQLMVLRLTSEIQIHPRLPPTGTKEGKKKTEKKVKELRNRDSTTRSR